MGANLTEYGEEGGGGGRWARSPRLGSMMVGGWRKGCAMAIAKRAYEAILNP